MPPPKFYADQPRAGVRMGNSSLPSSWERTLPCSINTHALSKSQKSRDHCLQAQPVFAQWPTRICTIKIYEPMLRRTIYLVDSSVSSRGSGLSVPNALFCWVLRLLLKRCVVGASIQRLASPRVQLDVYEVR